MDVRAMRKEDLVKVRHICEASWKGQAGDWFLEQKYGLIGGRTWFEWFWPNITAKFGEHPEWMFVSESGKGEIAGFVSLSLDHDRKTGSVGYNAVHPDCRGQGIGKSQIQHIFKIFQREKMEYAEVIVALNEGHQAAKKMYESFGFQKMGVMISCYGKVSCEGAASGGEEALVEISPEDYSAFAELAENSIEQFHYLRQVEKIYGKIGPLNWKQRLWSNIRSELLAGKSRGFFSAVSGEKTGMAVFSKNTEKSTGFISCNTALPGSGDCHERQLKEAMREFKTSGMKYAQASCYENNEGAAEPKLELLDRYQLTDVIVRSEYKFRKL